MLTSEYGKWHNFSNTSNYGGFNLENLRCSSKFSSLQNTQGRQHGLYDGSPAYSMVTKSFQCHFPCFTKQPEAWEITPCYPYMLQAKSPTCYPLVPFWRKAYIVRAPPTIPQTVLQVYGIQPLKYCSGVKECLQPTLVVTWPLFSMPCCIARGETMGSLSPLAIFL